ncbi:hypothetical protein H2199_000613 [Coniosporium tulheliwenetii]|uniref:Uncharacterized protein n=1 Tax=Coniosporium tulheliwenetii TaxID=3383036 RepID=A0ACC2ZMA1_9PEZI|nr:hypothetical protein H2199_000613 [Cladosporium sp. JES 115]
MCWELAFNYYGLGCTHREHVDLIELCQEAQQSQNEQCRPLAAPRTMPCWGECRTCRGAGPALIKKYIRVPGGEVEVTDQRPQMISPSPTEEEVQDDKEASKARVRFDVKGKTPMRTSESAPGKSWISTEDPHINSIGWGNEGSEESVEIKPKESVQSLLDKQRQRFLSDDEAERYAIEESIRESTKGVEEIDLGDNRCNEATSREERQIAEYDDWVEKRRQESSGPSNASSKESVQPTTPLAEIPDTPSEAFDSFVEEEEEEEIDDSGNTKIASSEGVIRSSGQKPTMKRKQRNWPWGNRPWKLRNGRKRNGSKRTGARGTGDPEEE